MNNIPTAEEFFKEEFKALRRDAPAISHDFKLKAIEFAKLHVETALRIAAENAEAIDSWTDGFSGSAASVDRNTILNAYPLENIK